MAATAKTATQADGDAFAQIMNTRTPKKPEVTAAPVGVLLAHYNSQVPAYNEAVALLAEKNPKATDLSPMDPLVAADKDDLINLIRKQNRRLGRTVRRRALELLEARIKGPDGKPMLNEDGRSVGLKYQEVLDIIKAEFPEASTSVACLRWYVVHLKVDANDLGLPWPDLPQVRPRAKGAKKEAA